MITRRSFLKILGFSTVGVVLATAIPKAILDFITSFELKHTDEDTLRALFGDIINQISEEEWHYLNTLNETYYLYTVSIKSRVKVSTDMKRLEKNDNYTIHRTSKNVFEASLIQHKMNSKFGVELTGDALKYRGQPYFWVRVRQYRALKYRPTNSNYLNSRGKQHSINSIKVVAYKGKKVGNPRWGTLNVVDQKYFGTYSSLGEAAKATGVTKAAISYCISGQLRFVNGYTFKKAV